MNQSKNSKLVAIWFVIGFIIVVFFQLRAHHPSGKPIYFPPEHDQAGQLESYSGLTRDASITYTPIIAGDWEVTDWHSALYMYECRALLRCAKELSIPMDGVSVQIAFYYLHLCIFVSYVSFVMYKAIKMTCNLAITFVSLCLSTHFMFEWMPVGLDFLFFIHFFILCCTFALLPKIGSKRMRTLAWIIIIASLFHAVNFRKNAILLVPFFAYVYVYVHHKIKVRKITSLLSWILISFCLSAVCTNLITWILPVRHTQPLSPMLASDLRIAAVLRGDQNQLRAELLHAGSTPNRVNHQYYDSLTAYWGSELSEENGNLIPLAYEIYMNHWKTNPYSMLASRVIQTVEFYCGGFFPPHFQPFIENLYPALKTNPSAWQFLISTTRNVSYGRIAVLLAGLALVFYVCFRRFKNKRSIDSMDRQALLVCMAALIYAGSFAIVPPTADARYLAPSLFVIWNACWLWLAFRLSHMSQENTYSLGA